MSDSSAWRLEQYAPGRGKVSHLAPPRFSASWTSGEPPRPLPAGLRWTDPGSGDGTDTLHLYGFAWRDSIPDAPAFTRLMREAAAALDAWIAERL